MRHAWSIVAATAVAAVGAAGVALAKGEPSSRPADPPPFTVVASGTASERVVAPDRRSDATIEGAVGTACVRALPRAVAAARQDATEVGSASGLRPGDVVAARRDVGVFFGGDEGRFGPGVWCGRMYVGRRTVTRPDGTTRRVSRYRRGCAVPRETTVRVTVTFAAERT